MNVEIILQNILQHIFSSLQLLFAYQLQKCIFFLGILSKLCCVIMIYRIFFLFLIVAKQDIHFRSMYLYRKCQKIDFIQCRYINIICSADAVFFYQYYAIVYFMHNKSCIYVAGFRTKGSYGVSNPVASKSIKFLCVLLWV